MKKAILTFIMAVVCTISMLAVPRGIYSNTRGTTKVYVNGADICIMRKDGTVILRGTIISENANGSFTIRYQTGTEESRNACFRDEDGTLCLNLYGYPGTFVKE